MGINSTANTHERGLVENRVNENALECEQGVYNPNVHLQNGRKVASVGRTFKPAENSHSYTLSTFFLLKKQKEEKEKKGGSLGESFEPKVDSSEVIDADLSHTAFAQPLTQAWQTYAAHKDGADIQAMRDLWRVSDKEMRKVINAMMGVG